MPHVVFLQFTFPVNLAQIVVSKMHCHYANAAVQPSMQLLTILGGMTDKVSYLM